MQPSKNETGTDDWVAVYSAVCNASGATMVGVNPFHSTMHYDISCFIHLLLKDPNYNYWVVSTEGQIQTKQHCI